MADHHWVVPHNAWLLTKYDCHINVEDVVRSAVCKYLTSTLVRLASDCFSHASLAAC